MKKKLLVPALLLLMVLTSGCIRQKDEYTINIDKNDNVILTETVGLGKEGLDSLSREINSFGGLYKGDISDASKQFVDEFINMTKKIRSINGFESQNYNDDKYIGFTQTKDNISIYDIKPEYFMPGLTSVSNAPIDIEKGLFNDTYKIHLKYNYKRADEEINRRAEEIEKQAKGAQYVPSAEPKRIFIDNQDGTYTIKEDYDANRTSDDNFNNIKIPNPDITLTIKIPTKATKHNATKVINDNEYQWNLFVLNSDVDINLEYKKQSSNVATIAIIITISLLLLAIGYLYIKYKDEITV